MLTESQVKTFPWHRVTWLVVNEGEVSDLCRIFESDVQKSVPEFEMVSGAPFSHLSAYPLLLRLSRHVPAINIVCTLGAAGVLTLVHSLADQGNSGPIYLHAASLQGDIRDTTGAGDCFTGYFVAGLMSLQGSIISRDDLVNVLRRCVQVSFSIPWHTFLLIQLVFPNH